MKYGSSTSIWKTAEMSEAWNDTYDERYIQFQPELSQKIH